MPTASPIMTARTGVVELMSVKLAVARMPSMPTPTPTAAAMSGVPAATREPKVMSRTIAAMATPTSSTAEMPIPTSWSMLPLRWTVRDGSMASARSARVSRSWATVLAFGVVPVVMEPTEASVCTWTSTWVPSAETDDATPAVLSPKGGETVATPSICDARRAKALTAGAWFSMRPLELVMRTCSLVPAAWGSRSVRTSRPRIDSVPEMVKVSSSWIPVVATTPPRAAMSSAQAARTRVA